MQLQTSSLTLLQHSEARQQAVAEWATLFLFVLGLLILLILVLFTLSRRRRKNASPRRNEPRPDSPPGAWVEAGKRAEPFDPPRPRGRT